jgi:periodic tryptophan protein 1
VSVENGHIFAFDGRSLPSNHRSQVCPATFTIAAHDGPVSALDVNPHIRGCLLSGGGDKLVKIWNINEINDKSNVSLATSRDLGIVSVSGSCGHSSTPCDLHESSPPND